MWGAGSARALPSSRPPGSRETMWNPTSVDSAKQPTLCGSTKEPSHSRVFNRKYICNRVQVGRYLHDIRGYIMQHSSWEKRVEGEKSFVHILVRTSDPLTPTSSAAVPSDRGKYAQLLSTQSYHNSGAMTANRNARFRLCSWLWSAVGSRSWREMGGGHEGRGSRSRASATTGAVERKGQLVEFWC